MTVGPFYFARLFRAYRRQHQLADVLHQQEKNIAGVVGLARMIPDRGTCHFFEAEPLVQADRARILRVDLNADSSGIQPRHADASTSAKKSRANAFSAHAPADDREGIHDTKSRPTMRLKFNKWSDRSRESHRAISLCGARRRSR